MSQSDLNISNVSRSLFRAENNEALQALASLSSGATEPTTTYAYQLWADTTAGLLKQRNAANNAWIEKGELTGINWGFLKTSGGTITGDLLLSSAAIYEAEGAGVSSAATTDIWAGGDGNTVHVTGNTGPITSFGTAPQAGAWMKVIFDSTPTLTQSANLNLNAGGSDIIIEAGDMALVYADTTTQFDVFVIRKTGVSITETPSGFKNKIIGGDFTINPWQRGSSFAAIASGAYSADRWQVQHVMDGVVSVLKTADAPTVAQAGIFSQHCFHVDVTTADASIAAGQYFVTKQAIEGLNAASFGFGQAGTRYVTLSFWHKHTKTGTYCVSFQNSANNRSYIAEYVQDVTDTWEFASLTIPVDTTGTWLYDNGIGLNVYFANACGTTFQTSAGSWVAGNYFASSNQVNNLDSTANNFKIALGKRYYMQDSKYVAALVSGAAVTGTVYSSEMRATPTIAGGGAGFTLVTSTSKQVVYYQTATANQSLTFSAEL
jgi:hypothetical protein